MTIHMRPIANSIQPKVITTITCDGGGIGCETIYAETYEDAMSTVERKGWAHHTDTRGSRRFICKSCQYARVE